MKIVYSIYLGILVFMLISATFTLVESSSKAREGIKQHLLRR